MSELTPVMESALPSLSLSMTAFAFINRFSPLGVRIAKVVSKGLIPSSTS